MDTKDDGYTRRLLALEVAGLRRLLPTQAPYRLHLRSLKLGRTLDVGCGVGRNLAALPAGSVGVDHNPESVRVCLERGLDALTSPEFHSSRRVAAGHFDSLLCAHVLEHMDVREGIELLRTYLPYVGSGGKVVIITPQEAGYRSDPTHRTYVTLETLHRIAGTLDVDLQRAYSFPLPRLAGYYFPYNEFVYLGRIR